MDTLIISCWVMVISSLRISFIRFIYVILWVRRPDLWESRTVCIYCARFLIVQTYDVDGYFLYEVVVDADYTDIYTYFWRKGLAGSRHWCTYTYLLFVSSLGAPYLYSDRVASCPSNRWTLSVFLQKSKIYFKYK